MKLYVPKEKAIRILEKRLSEIDSLNFEPKSWRKKTKNDIEEIFRDLTKGLQVSFILFDNDAEGGKKEARELIKSYIESIKEYILDTPQYNIPKLDVTPFLKDEIEKLKESKKVLEKENNYLSETLLNKDKEIINHKNSIKELKENTVQLSDITLKKLLSLIGNLPVKQITTLVALLITIISTSFYLGNIYQETSFKNQEFVLNRQYENAIKERKQYSDSLSLMKKKKKKNVNIGNDKIDIIVFNSTDKAISMKFENVSKNNNKISSHGLSIHPNKFGKISLDKFNYKWTAKKFVDYKKSAITEKSIYLDDIIRVDDNEGLKLINLK